MNNEKIVKSMIKKIEELEAKREILENADFNKKPIILAIINDLNEELENENK